MLKKSFALAIVSLSITSNIATAAKANTSDYDYICVPVLIASSRSLEKAIFDSTVQCKEIQTENSKKLDDAVSCYQQINEFLRSKPLLRMPVNELQEKIVLMETECKKI